MRTPGPIDEIRALRESCLETDRDGERIWTSAWECYSDAFDNAEGLVTRLVNAHDGLVQALRDCVLHMDGLSPESLALVRRKARAVLASLESK